MITLVGNNPRVMGDPHQPSPRQRDGLEDGPYPRVLDTLNPVMFPGEAR